MGSVLVRNHDQYNDVARLDLESGSLSWLEAKGVPEGEKPTGFVKQFATGGAVVAFQARDVWFLQIGSQRWMLGDLDLHLSRSGFGLFAKFTVQAEGFRRTFLDFTPGALLQRLVDPTYDWIDKMRDDFPGWVVELHEKQQGLRPLTI